MLRPLSMVPRYDRLSRARRALPMAALPLVCTRRCRYANASSAGDVAIVRSIRKLTTSLHAWLGRLSHHEILLLVALVLLAGATWLFVEIADEVLEGETASLDRRILLAMRDRNDPNQPWGPPWVQETARDFTAIGGVAVTACMTLAVIGGLLMQRKVHAAVLVGVAIGGGGLLSTLLKSMFDRPRPDLVPHGSYVYTTSFPSGHSMLSAITFLTLGALLARVEGGRRMKVYLLSIACSLTFLVGLSRVYLGVHWPTDVLAGWTAGGAWATACWIIARHLQQRGQVETDHAPTA